MYNNTASTAYRSDIDTLRAFAVVTVVLYHIGWNQLTGGFVGVDVFFVISGYLITGQLTNRMLGSTPFSFLEFYTRRFKRLYPALSMMLLACAVFGLFIMSATAQKDLGREMRAVATISINYYFLDWDNDYFKMVSDARPLLHMWSLSVEEQFYLIWPALLLLMYRLAKSLHIRFIPFASIGLTSILICSFLWSYYCSFHNINQAFFGMPSRAWEFAAGGLLSLGIAPTPKANLPIGSLLQCLGITLLCCAVLHINHHMIFPGKVVLLPILGSMLFIIGGDYGTYPVLKKILCHKYVTHIGKVSYSFYLWHWVLLSFVRYWFMGRDLGRDMLVGFGCAFIVAHFSYLYVELPIRLGTTPFPRLNHLSFRHGLYTMLFLYVIGNIELFYPVSITGAQKFITRIEDDSVHLPPHCAMPKNGMPLGSIGTCSFGAATQPLHLMVWGDSHAGRMIPIYQQYAQQHPIRILTRIYNGCPPLIPVLPLSNNHSKAECLNFANAVSAEIPKMKTLGMSGVILNARWIDYYRNNTLIFRQRLEKTLALLSAQGMKVLIIAPEPELTKPAPECLAHFAAASCNIPVSNFQHERDPIMSILKEEQQRYPNIQLMDTTPFFCDKNWCYAQSGNIVNFMDNNHITTKRALSMYSYFSTYLNWLSLKDTKYTAHD